MIKKPKPVELIVALDRNNGIGKGNDLPWRLVGDMKYFKLTTSTVRHAGGINMVIMGRNTWESIPEKFRPLPDRLNGVVTSTLKDLPNARVFASLEDAISCGQGMHTVERIFVIGGAQLYAEALPLASRLYITRIEAAFDCDKFFPQVGSEWEEIYRGQPQHERGAEFVFTVLEKPPVSAVKEE